MEIENMWININSLLRPKKEKKHNYQYQKGKMKHDYITFHNKKLMEYYE